MSDPQPASLKPKPRRAEPLQPDKPGSGNAADQDTLTEAAGKAQESTARKNAEQTKAALDNVREGYK